MPKIRKKSGKRGRPKKRSKRVNIKSSIKKVVSDENNILDFENPGYYFTER